MASDTLLEALELVFEAGKNKLRSANWSSIIGIITAIVGNILISFALNTQRYAHVRLQKAEQEADIDSGSPTPRNGHSRSGSYDSFSIQKSPKGGRRTASILQQDNSAREQPDDSNEDYDHADTDALLPEAQKDDGDDTSTLSGSSGRRGKTNYLRSPFWWLGIVLMVIGEAGNFLAYGFAPASIVSPLGVVALISNCLIAPIMLHEKFRKRDLLGILIAVGGAVTVVLSAEGSNPKLGPDEIYELVKRWEFLAYMGATAAMIVILMALSNSFGHRLILIDLGLVGLFGGYTALSTKGVASLLSYKLWRILTFPVTYVLVLVLVLTAVLQIKYVNRALARFDSTQVIPVQFVIFTISVIVGSAVLYRDFESMTKAKVFQFLGGCGMTFVGVWFLTSGRSEGGDKNNLPGRDAERGIILRDDEPLEQEQGQDQLNTETPPPKRSVANCEPLPASFTTAGSTRSQTQAVYTHVDATTSTPVLPTQRSPQHLGDAARTITASQQPSGRPSLPSIGSDPHPALITPSRDIEAGLDPIALDRFGISRARNSIAAGVSPKPLTTPLSSGLSVVVADNLRKTQSVRGSRRKTSSARPDERHSVEEPRLTAGTDVLGSEGPSSEIRRD